MSTNKNCFFCGSKDALHASGPYPFTNHYRCAHCGDYALDDKLADFEGAMDSLDESKRFKIACVLNERRLRKLGGITVLSKDTDKTEKVSDFPEICVTDLLDEFPKSAGDLLDRTLLNLSRLRTRPFEAITLELVQTEGHLHLFTADLEERYALLRELAEDGFIRFNKTMPGEQWDVFVLTTKFRAIVENLKRTEVDNKRAFVAMWFDESMDAYYQDGIKKAIEDAGYEPIRIDLQNFNDKICDEIIAEIRRSKFLIADFSGMRTGVFFEAGFAKGLGREVIFTVKKACVEKLKEHFDTRQYNHIVYDSPDDLRKQLYDRIRVTIV